LQTGYIRVDFVTFQNGMRPVECAAHPTGRSLEGAVHKVDKDAEPHPWVGL